MNKKFSTLVASLLLGTSFGAFAQTELQITEGDFKSGSTYFLTTGVAKASAKALVVKGAELEMLAWAANPATTTVTEIEEMTKAEREFAMWTVTSTKVIGGTTVYEFTNKATGKKLQVSSAAPNAAYTANGTSQFEWITLTGTAATAISTPAALTNDAGDNEVTLQSAFVVTDAAGIPSGSATNFDQIDATKGKFQTRLLTKIAAATRTTAAKQGEASTDMASLTITQGAATIAQITDAKAIVKAFDALLSSLSIDVTKATYLADYKVWSVAVKGLSIPSSGTVNIDASDAYTKLAAAQADVAKFTANDYGWAIAEDVSTISGVVYVANGTSIVAASTAYKKGTIFVTDFKVLPALMPEAEYVTTPAAAHVVADTDETLYNAAFANEFNTGNQVNSAVVANLGFDGPEAETNVLADAEIQLVQRNLLEVASDGTLARKDPADPLAPASFKSTTLIMDKKTGKYLVVKPDTYEPSNPNSTYYKFGWADLKPLTSFVGSAVADVAYYGGKDNLAAAYLFDVKYDMNADSLTIAPKFTIKKTATSSAADTIGTSYTIATNSALVASLKQFSGAVEMTLVDPTAETAYRINTGATASGSGWELTSVPSDVYFIQLITKDAAKKADNEKFYTAGNSLIKGSYEAFNHIPANQWALVKDANGLVTVKNRATAAVFKTFENAQLYKAGGDYVSIYKGDTLKLTSVAPEFKMDSTIGYFAYDAKKNDVLKYQLTYFNELDATKNVGVRKDSTLFVDKSGEGIWFQMKVADAAAEYGADAIKDVSKKLKKATYTIDAIVNGKAYKVVLENGKYAISDKSSNKTAVKFDVKELMHNDLCWYVLNNLTSTNSKVSVDDNTLNLFNELTTEARTSMFALTQGNAPKYRRFGETIADEIAKNDTAYVEFFKANEPNRFLYENSANIVAENGTEFAKDSLNFLGMYNKADMKRNASIFVDTAYVRNDTIKPLYMLALGVQFTEGKADVPCPDHGMTCEHAIHGAPSYTNGRYLVALNDSTANNPSAMYQGNVRLAFVPAKHIADTLVINRSEFTGVKDKTAKDSLIINGTNMTAATFAFRLVNDDPADFYMETVDGQYVRIHNGVPVLVTEIEDATVFNVNKTNETPTANEDIDASTISVIAKEGVVIISGAQGKKVVISNVLGQTVANTVISSDKAEIAAPAGVVVVAVEAAVKAIVK